jgi:hypothetical protein
MSFGVIDVRGQNFTFTTIDTSKPQKPIVDRFCQIEGLIESSKCNVFVIQGLSDVVVVRDNSDEARFLYENQRKCVECMCKICCFAYYIPCFNCLMKFESRDRLYSSIIGETFLFRDRCFIFDLKRFNGDIQTVKECLELERDSDEKISDERRSALTEALKAEGVFAKFVELVKVAKKYPHILFLVDSGLGIQGLTPKVNSYISIHFESKNNPMRR